MQCFHATVNRVTTRFPKETEVANRETVSRVVFILFLELLTRQMLGISLLDGNNDHLLDQARSELMKQEHQVGSLDNCIDDLQQQAYAQRLELEDAHHGYIESLRELSRLQEELSMKKKSAARDSDTEFSRDGRNEESSRITSRRILCTKMRESHERQYKGSLHKCRKCKSR